MFNDEVTPEAKKDFFGGVAAKQAIVCALMQGPEQHFLIGEEVAKEMYSPVMRSHRITVEQMAMLEPAMAETISSMMVTVLGEAMEEAVSRGVPYAAAKDFMLGHINIQLAIVFEKSNPFSDACKIAIEYGRKTMIKEGWKDLYNPDKLYEQIDVMLHPEKLKDLILRSNRHAKLESRTGRNGLVVGKASEGLEAHTRRRDRRVMQPQPAEDGRESQGFGIPSDRLFTSFDEMLAHGDIDIVDFVTGPRLIWNSCARQPRRANTSSARSLSRRRSNKRKKWFD